MAVQIVIDKGHLVNMFAVALFSVVGNDYQEAKNCVDEILENIGYIELPKGYGRLIDADKIQFESADFDTYNDYSLAFDIVDTSPTIIEADKEV